LLSASSDSRGEVRVPDSSSVHADYTVGPLLVGEHEWNGSRGSDCLDNVRCCLIEDDIVPSDDVNAGDSDLSMELVVKLFEDGCKEIHERFVVEDS